MAVNPQVLQMSARYQLTDTNDYVGKILKRSEMIG